MATTRYVALLRGVNVGGRNKVDMGDLRRCVEAAGYEEVQTYIQSGNVLFETGRPARGLVEHLEAVLQERFGIPLVVVVRSHRQLRGVVRRSPDGFGDQPDRFHSDVIFLRSPLSPAAVMRVVELREGVDRAWPGTGVVYFERLTERRSQSRMSRIVGTPEYQRMTIRNWSTTTKLLALMDERSQ